MQVHSKSIFDVFDSKRRYLVPLFQRQYVWSKEAQWEPLWEDIKSKACAKLENRNVAPHFLGALVLDQIRGTYGNAVPAHIIIDGQQRLTTFQIFLATFRNICKKLEDVRHAEELDRYILNTGIMENEQEEQFKIWPTKMDQAQFNDVILSSSTDALFAKYPNTRPRMIQAYHYFSGSINEYLRDNDFPQDNPTKIEALYQALRKDLEVVTIELEGNDDAQVIFETLNARGEPLLPSDLLRNYLFMRASQNNENQDLLYENYWEQFDHHFWKKEEKQGRLKRPRIDLFMQHFLQVKRASEINIRRMFQEYKNWIKDNKPYGTVENELIDLDRYAKIYKTFLEPDTINRIGMFTWRLRELDISTVYPLLLYLLADSNLAETELIGIITDIESYLIRRLVCDKTTKNYNKIFLQAMRDLQKGTINRGTLQKYLSSPSGDAVNWPDDAEFYQAWMNQKAYEKLKPKKVELILRAIEDELHNEKTERISIQSSLTIEHIMPEKWIEKWPMSDGSAAKDWLKWLVDKNEENQKKFQLFSERQATIHTLGNLTLLTRSLNSSISNDIYDIKRPEIIKQSALRLNTYFQDISAWDETAIKNRGQYLFEVAKRTWPYPAKNN